MEKNYYLIYMTTKRDLNREYVNYLSLEESGYHKCEGTISNLKHGASNLFQKTVRNSKNEKMYFINVYEFDFNGYPGYVGNTLRYQAEVRFYRKHQEFNVDLLFLEKTTIKEMEAFFDDVYISMNCDIDHHNN